MRHTTSHRSIVLLAIGLLCAGASIAGERFENATAGISLERPAGWSTLSMQQVEENRRRVRLSDKEMEEAIRNSAGAPLFAFTRHPEPHSDQNPSIQVMLRPLGSMAGSSPKAILKSIAEPLRQTFQDFQFDKEIHETEISGLKAAHTRVRFTVRNDAGEEFKTLSRLWIVPRGAHLFIIGMSGPQGGPEVSEMEFGQVLASIRIDP
ncbi:MAG: hypothetical protein ACREAA_21885 [Candidatus Polarisedimenticolia bacterium]